MTTETTPGAQGPEGGQAVPQGTNPQPEGQNPGIQHRIDQLTARYHEAERRNAELQGRFEAQQQMMLQQMQQAQQPQPRDPFEHLPEDYRDAARAAAQAAERQAAARIQQLEQRYGQQLAAMQLQNAIQGQPPQVAQMAQQLYANWQRAGHTGWTPQDAVIYARGQLGIPAQQAAVPTPPPDPFGGSFTHLPQSAPPPPPARPGAPNAAPPPDIESDPVAAAAYYEQKLGNNSW